MPANFQLKSEARDKQGRWTKGTMTPAKFIEHPDSVKRRRYLSPTGKEYSPYGSHIFASGRKLPKHMKNVRIPPAWSGVHVNEEENAKVWAQGQDKKGKTQTIYNPSYVEHQEEVKFKRIQKLDKEFSEIEQKNESFRNAPKTRDSADCLKLIMHTGLRPGGSETKGDKKAYGATTLQGKHVVQLQKGTYLRFVGKKGVNINIKVDDPVVSNMLASRSKKAGSNGSLFPDTSAHKLLDHVHSLGGKIKVKDFRTLLANRLAIAHISSLPSPKNEKQLKNSMKVVAVAVAERLGNTPSVALKSYINPVVWKKWKGAIA